MPTLTLSRLHPGVNLPSSLTNWVVAELGMRRGGFGVSGVAGSACYGELFAPRSHTCDGLYQRRPGEGGTHGENVWPVGKVGCL